MNRNLYATPRLSIGLPAYNGESFLAESLDALLGQSFADFELIISDNASTDETAAICQRYAKDDPRIRYFRQPQNIGSAPNHNFVLARARGELFKWAATDDLYARDLLQRCVTALDEHPEAVLAHCWTAAVDDSGRLTQAHEYPLATDSPDAAVRFRSMLFGTGDNDFGVIRADDQYGVIRTEVLRRVRPIDSFHHSDRIIMADLALHGQFHQTPEWLYFRRDHPGRAQRRASTTQAWCSNMDPRRLRQSTGRLYAEYWWGYVRAIRRAPLSAAERSACYRLLARWTASRAARVAGRLLRSGQQARPALLAAAALPAISVNDLVPGRRPWTA